MAIGNGKVAGVQMNAEQRERTFIEHTHLKVIRYELDEKTKHAMIVGHRLNEDGKPMQAEEQRFYLRQEDRPVGKSSYDMVSIEEMSDPAEALKHVHPGGLVKLEGFRDEGDNTFSGSHVVRINTNSPKLQAKISSVNRFVQVQDTRWRRKTDKGFSFLDIQGVLGREGLGYDIDNLTGDEIAALADKAILEKLTPKKRMGDAYRNELNAKVVSTMVMFRPTEAEIFHDLPSLLEGVADHMTFDQSKLPPRHVIIRVPGDEGTVIELRPTWDREKQSYIENGEVIVANDLKTGRGAEMMEQLKAVMESGGVVEVIPGAEVNNLQSVAREFISEEIYRLAESKGYQRDRYGAYSNFRPGRLTQAYIGVQVLAGYGAITISRVEPASKPVRSFEIHEMPTVNFDGERLIAPVEKNKAKPKP